ncbi:MAG: EamA family transporter RarD [Halieaceae bacterium]
MAALLDNISDKQRGTLLGVTAYLIWGFAALYWVQLQLIDTRDLLAHRVVWTVFAVVLTLMIAGRLGATMRLLRQPKTMAIMAAAAFFSAANWGVFIWAVTHEQAMEASLGYFLLPLVNVVIGLTIFGERIDTAQKWGIGFAVAAVLVQVAYYGGLPVVALSLALSFGLYGAIRKGIAIESMEGLLLEALLMLPFALAWLIYREGGGFGVHGIKIDLLLIGAGFYSAVPLMTYVAASRLLPLTALGLVFYIGPTAQLIVAYWVFGEPLVPAQMVAFGLVWVGLFVVTVDGYRRARRVRRRAEVAANQN